MMKLGSMTTVDWEPSSRAGTNSALETYVPPTPKFWPIDALIMDRIATTEDSSPSNWLAESLLRLNKLATLEEDWDGEGGPPVPTEILESAALVLQSIALMWGNANIVLPVPHAVPITGGAMQLEWRAHKRYFEIEFVTADKVRVVARRGRSIRSLGTVDLFQSRFRRLLGFIS